MENTQNAALRLYAERVREKIQELAPEITTCIRQVSRINRECLCIFVADAVDVAHGLSLNDCLEGHMTVEQAAGTFVQKVKAGIPVHPELYLEVWDEIKGNIYPILINTARNEELLKEAVNRPFFDLSICYRLCFFTEGSVESSLVQSWMLNRWQVSTEELHEQALKNLTLIDEGVKSLDEVCAYLTYPQLVVQYGKETADALVEDFLRSLKEDPCYIPMYVWSNRFHTWGSGVILREEALKDFFEKYGNGRYVFIMPSSVDEVLLVTSGLMEASVLRNMVGQVNEMAVPDSKFLSDNIYIYDGLTGEIEIYDEAAARASLIR